MFRFSADSLFLIILRIGTFLCASIALLIFIFIFMESFSSFKSPGVLSFFTDESWHPSVGLYNLVPMVVASILLLIGSFVLAVPIGILSGVFCNFYGNALIVGVYRNLVQLLAGIPSVVFGFWGLMVLAPKIAEIKQPGVSLLSGIIILFIMTVPTMALAADASIRQAPKQLVQGAYALGFTKSKTIYAVVLPAVKSGLLVGAILQTGRAIGETMAVLMVTGNVVQLPSSIFDPVRALTSNIALEMSYAMGDHKSALFFSGLVLISFIILLVSLTGVIERKIHAQ